MQTNKIRRTDVIYPGSLFPTSGKKNYGYCLKQNFHCRVCLKKNAQRLNFGCHYYSSPSPGSGYYCVCYPYVQESPYWELPNSSESPCFYLVRQNFPSAHHSSAHHLSVPN